MLQISLLWSLLLRTTNKETRSISSASTVSVRNTRKFNFPWLNNSLQFVREWSIAVWSWLPRLRSLTMVIGHDTQVWSPSQQWSLRNSFLNFRQIHLVWDCLDKPFTIRKQQHSRLVYMNTTPLDTDLDLLLWLCCRSKLLFNRFHH